MGAPFADTSDRGQHSGRAQRTGRPVSGPRVNPVTTIWGFLSQVLNEDHSCRDAVSRIIAHRAANGNTVCSPNTASYCNARSRILTDVLSTLARQTAEELQMSVAHRWKWNGRSVFIVDGSSVSMPDTRKISRCIRNRPSKRQVWDSLSLGSRCCYRLLTRTCHDLAIAPS